MATAKEKAFERKVRQLLKNVDKLGDDGVRRVIRLLSDARKNVAATVGSTEWEIFRLQELKGGVERALQEFGTKFGVEMRETQREFWARGIDLVDVPIREVGIVAAIPEIDTTALAIMQDFSADLITNLTQDAIKKINTEITLGLMGNKSPFEVMQAVGRNLKDKSIFTSIQHRASVIVEHEAGRVLEMAGQARKEAAARVVPGLQKQWHYGLAFRRVPRVSHQAADGQVRDIDRPFNVGGELLQFPRGPAGSAKNTINCKCTSLAFHADWDAAVEREAGR